MCVRFIHRKRNKQQLQQQFHTTFYRFVLVMYISNAIVYGYRSNNYCSHIILAFSSFECCKELIKSRKFSKSISQFTTGFCATQNFDNLICIMNIAFISIKIFSLWPIYDQKIDFSCFSSNKSFKSLTNEIKRWRST